jgi:hypothetical protein
MIILAAALCFGANLAMMLMGVLMVQEAFSRLER